MGLPGALVWGLVMAVRNFFVYLGPAAVVVGLLLAGVATFAGVKAVAPTVAFVLLNAVERQFVTPAFLARQLSVNPLLIFVVLLVGIWLWGPLGGFVAIPILVWVLVFSDMLEADVPAEPAKTG
jgi:predicted PurR-regulated permease PerM